MKNTVCTEERVQRKTEVGKGAPATDNNCSLARIVKQNPFNNLIIKNSFGLCGFTSLWPEQSRASLLENPRSLKDMPEHFLPGFWCDLKTLTVKKTLLVF
ncbi:hypothetical protein CHARACLAT_021824 [Characodon lateralis]|uniref:Uncharacterized protein n=1 Tax=Characodon lateralis TaxID=208331 RepID=A0ABU7EWW0_9TELE|nr:hypothetical protein [Characodon lateralis]